MPTPPISKEEAERRMALVEQCLREGHVPKGMTPPNGKRGAVREATVRDGKSQGSAYHWYEVASRTLGRHADWSLWQKPEARPETEGEEAVKPSAEQGYKDEINRLRRDLEDANRQLNATEHLREAVFGLSKEPLRPVDWKPRPTRKRGDRPETAMIFASDFQWGEVIEAEEMDGLNAFNREIGAARFQRLIDGSLNLLLNYGSANYDRLFVLLGGDMISGDIHMDLIKSNDLSSLPAVRDLAEHVIGGLEKLLREMPDVPITVISVPGNHGRTTIKPQSKMYVETNYDDLLAWVVETYFAAKGEKRIEFRRPKSGDAYWSVHGVRFLLTHGDRIGSRGGQGFVGPIATIARGQKKLIDQYATVGKIIDFILTGHFHVSVKTEYGFGNGCLPGYSEYARDLRAKPKPPTQWLFRVHPDTGLHDASEVFVGGPGEGSLCEPWSSAA